MRRFAGKYPLISVKGGDPVRDNGCGPLGPHGFMGREEPVATLVKDAHTTRTMELDNGSKIEAETVVRELNIAMKWLSYPGRRNSTATAEEVSFAAS